MKEELKSLIDKHQIISFDIFDTLLFRNVYKPIDIFKLVEKQLGSEVDDFCNIRVSSECESRKNVEAGECNLNEIYDEISNKIGKELAEKAKRIELELELEFIDVNPFMKDIFDYALENEKQVYLISDMYLPSEFIYKMLKKANYKKVPLYVSCEYRAGKGSGQLFEIVRNENNLDKAKWLHIGDNVIGDYEKPINFGINAYNYKNIREYDKSIIPSTIEESIITAIQNNYLYNGNEIDYWSKFGMLYISPIYFGFTFWLYKLTQNVDNLFFLARDGYIIKKIYEMFPNVDKYINYIYCSRKSMQIPSLLNQLNDYMVHILTMKNDVVKSSKKLREIFENAQLKCDDKYLDIIKQFGFEDFDDEVTSDKYKSAKKLVAFLLDDVKENLKEQNTLAINYLNQEGMKKFDKINVVDVGWAGSIQYSIKKLLDKDVVGYYFGTVYSQDKDNLFSSTFGWYFDLDDDAADKEEVLSNVMMYELIFSAPHGTTLGYKKCGKIEPILDEEDNIEVIEKFQDAALEIIEKYIKYFKYFESLDKHFCLNRYRKYINDRNYEDMLMFSTLSNDFVLGSSKRYPYVQAFTKKEINKNFRKFNIKRNNSIWKGSYVITDAKNMDEINAINSKIRRNENIRHNIKKVLRKIVPVKIRIKLLNIYRKRV